MPNLTGTHYDLAALARQEMIAEGFTPDFPPEAQRQVAALRAHATPPAPDGTLRDLRSLLWSSIDNDTSRDLDQIEVAERLANGDIRIRIGIADVDSDVPKGSPIDTHAAANCTTVYTGVKNFPMLPDDLSTDLTSLNEHADRLSVVVELTVAADGSVQDGTAYRAVTRNAAQLAYSSVGPWLEGQAAAPAKAAASQDLQAQTPFAGRSRPEAPRATAPARRAGSGSQRDGSDPVVRRKGDRHQAALSQPGFAVDRGFHGGGQRRDRAAAARQPHLLHPAGGENAGALGPHRGTGRAHGRQPARRPGLRRAEPLPDEAPGRGTPCITPIYRWRW
jgi:hypothetical protein